MLGSSPAATCHETEVWTCVDPMSIHCQYITTSAHDRNPRNWLHLRRRAHLAHRGGYETVVMRLGATAGEDLPVAASPPERIKRFEPVS